MFYFLSKDEDGNVVGNMVIDADSAEEARAMAEETYGDDSPLENITIEEVDEETFHATVRRKRSF